MNCIALCIGQVCVWLDGVLLSWHANKRERILIIMMIIMIITRYKSKTYNGGYVDCLSPVLDVWLICQGRLNWRNFLDRYTKLTFCLSIAYCWNFACLFKMRRYGISLGRRTATERFSVCNKYCSSSFVYLMSLFDCGRHCIAECMFPEDRKFCDLSDAKP